MQELREENHVQRVRRDDCDKLDSISMEVAADRHELSLLRNRRVFPRELRNAVLGAGVLERKSEKWGWNGRRTIVGLIVDCLRVAQQRDLPRESNYLDTGRNVGFIGQHRE